MAIVIPSKHIYDKDNNKIRDNKIDRVEVNATEITPNNEYETPVYNEEIRGLSLTKQETTNEDLQETWLINTGAYLFTGACAYAGYNSQKYHEQKIYIPKVKNNSFINKLLLGVNDENNPNIKATFVGTISKGTTNGTWYGNFETSGKDELIVTKGTINYSNPTEIKMNERYDIPKEIFFTYESENRGNPTATTKLIDIGNLSTVNFDEETKDGIEYYTLQLKILCGIRIVYMGGYDNGMQATITNCPFVMSGTYEEYTPTSIEITVYGNTIGIDLTDKTVYIPDESGNKPFSVEGNELMQTSNYNTSKEFLLKEVSYYDLISPTSYYVGKSNYNNHYYTSVHIGGKENSWETYVEYKDTNTGVTDTVIIPPRQNTHSPALETIGADTIEIIKVYNKSSIYLQFQDTLLEYSNGKETATILCDIYNYDNSNLYFHIGDVVIPMVYGANGVDKPMSKYKDGTPKKFKVLGTRIFYDGAVWQELTLQETLE